MIVKIKSSYLLCLLLVIAGFSLKLQAQSSELSVKQSIESAFQSVRPNWAIHSVVKSPLAGLYEVKVVNGPLVYANADGSFFVTGDLYQITGGDFVNVTEQQREGLRAQLMGMIKTEDMIVFSPKGPVKSYVNVFTDIDCGYCRKLHAEVPELNRMGVEVRYLAYPRAGLGSLSYQKIATAFCAKDKKQTLTHFKQGKSVDINVCKNNPVADQLTLGGQIGVNGTPALITPEGKLLPGYMPAKELASALGVQ